MTFLTGVVKMGYSKQKISAVLSEPEQARKHRQKLAKVAETFAAYRLREMKTSKQESSLLPGGGPTVLIAMIVGCMASFPYRLKNSPIVCGRRCTR